MRGFFVFNKLNDVARSEWCRGSKTKGGVGAKEIQPCFVC